MGDKLAEALGFVKQAIWAKSDEDSQKLYDSWSSSFDAHMKVMDCQVPVQAAELFKKNTGNMNVSQVLDVGGGKV